MSSTRRFYNVKNNALRYGHFSSCLDLGFRRNSHLQAASRVDGTPLFVDLAERGQKAGLLSTFCKVLNDAELTEVGKL